MNSTHNPLLRTCTCHPDDSPPRPCPRLFATSECKTEALRRALREAAETARLILAYEQRDPMLEVICARAREIIRTSVEALADYPSPPSVPLTSQELIELRKRHEDAECSGGVKQ